MSDAKIQKLIETKDEIKNLKAVKCRITHERVRIDKKTNLPITQNIGEKVYERIGFCPSEIREQRISCGHTMAQYILEDALSLLDSEGENIVDLKNELMNATYRIHQLDHKKGDAEKNLAILFEKKHQQNSEISETEITSATNTIKEIEGQHDESVDKINDLRNQIVTKLETVIKNMKNG